MPGAPSCTVHMPMTHSPCLQPAWSYCHRQDALLVPSCLSPMPSAPDSSRADDLYCHVPIVWMATRSDRSRLVSLRTDGFDRRSHVSVIGIVVVVHYPMQVHCRSHRVQRMHTQSPPWPCRPRLVLPSGQDPAVPQRPPVLLNPSPLFGPLRAENGSGLPLPPSRVMPYPFRYSIAPNRRSVQQCRYFMRRTAINEAACRRNALCTAVPSRIKSSAEVRVGETMQSAATSSHRRL